MNNIDKAIEEVLREFAKLLVDYEQTPSEATKSVVLLGLIDRKGNEIKNNARMAGIDLRDIAKTVSAFVGECRARRTSVNVTDPISEKELLPPWTLQRDTQLDADWRELAVADETYLRTALSQHTCDPEAIEEIVAQVDQQAAPLRMSLRDAVGAAVFAIQLKLFGILDALDIKLEILSDKATSRLVSEQLLFVSCEDIKGSKVKYRFDPNSKNKIDASFTVAGVGLSGQQGSALKHARDFDAEAGESWVTLFETEEESLPARLVWGKRTIAQHTFKSTLREGLVRREKLSPEQWKRVLTQLKPVHRGERDCTQDNSRKIATETLIFSFEAETTFAANLTAGTLGIKIGPKIAFGKGRTVTIKYCLPGSHRYALFTDSEARAAWYHVIDNIPPQPSTRRARLRRPAKA